MNLKKATVAFICVFLAAVISVGAASQNDLNNLLTKENKIKQSLESSKTQKKITETEYYAIEAKITSIQNEINAINLRLYDLDAKKTAITNELNEAIEKEKQQEQKLKTRLRVMYENGATSYFTVLLSSESIFDFFYNLEILRQISQHDDKILKELTENKKVIAAKKEELEGVIKEVENEKSIQVGKQAALQAESAKKNAYLKQIEGDINAYQKNLNQIEAEKANIRAQIAAAARTQSSSGNAKVPVKYSGGAFQWPVPSTRYITSYYATSRSFGTVRIHRGIDIGASSGSSVVAAADGVVVTATYNRSYGNYVSINHGGGLVTLYAHNSSLLVRPGQSVKKGQQIAVSGSTGNSTGPHVHFEVRVNGTRVNPWNYL